MNEERDFYEETESYQRRARKAKRKKYPRDRSFAVKELQRTEKIAGENKRQGEAKEKIQNRLKHFPAQDTSEGKKQVKIYIRWVKDSLDQGCPILHDGDIEIKTAVASVKAGGQSRQKSKNSVRAVHLPTLIGVRNEEERSLEQNTLNAKENLCYLLTNHLQLWKTLNIASPSQNVEKKVIEMLQL